MTDAQSFPYDLAFDRNLGWVTDWEQLALRARRVAIAGMGGVGGIYLLTLARLGIGAFTIADFDEFEFANFNRQIGALVSTIGRPKAEVLQEMALQINPELQIRRFDTGVQPDSVDDFLAGVDLFVDGLDFFEIPIRRQLFARCRALGIPAVTAAPIGAGVGYLIFTPGGMSFESYFRMEGRRPEEQFLHFLIGLVPKGLHRRYLVDPTRINLAARKGPSTSAAVQLCAGVTAAAALKLLLGRAGIRPAPWHHHFDAYLDRMVTTRLPFGLAGPVQQAKLAVARRTIRRAQARRPATAQPATAQPVTTQPAPDPPATGRTVLAEILNLARWAPSGDNVQPWRFEPAGNDAVIVHIRREPDNPYEYSAGEPTSLSAGMLLETMRIAATGWSREFSWSLVGRDQIRVELPPVSHVEPDPLLKFLTLRSVDRRPYRRRPLTAAEIAALESALQGRLPLRWHAGAQARLAIARLGAAATDIRLRCPEMFPIHQAVIDWERPLSPKGIPARSVGLAPPMLPLFRWAMASWPRMQRLNLLGTASAAAQLDYLPALQSSSFAVFLRPPGATGIEAILAAGQAIQRFWLTATMLGLAMQPGIAPIAFARYGQAQHRFTAEASLLAKAGRLAGAFSRTLGAAPDQVLFIARIGEPRPRLPSVRSARLPLTELMVTEAGGSPSTGEATPAYDNRPGVPRSD